MVNEPRERIVVDQVAFGQVFRFQRILSTITHAMQPPRIVAALLMVVALVAVGELWDSWSGPPVFHPDGVLVEETSDWQTARDINVRRVAERQGSEVAEELELESLEQFRGSLPIEKVRRGIVRGFRQERSGAVRSGIGPEGIAALDAEYRRSMRILEEFEKDHPYEATARQATRSLLAIVSGVLHLDPGDVFRSLTDFFIRTPVALWREAPWFAVIYGFFALLVIAVGGGALARMSACEIAGRERLRTSDAYLYSIQNWIKLLLAPLMPLLLAGFLALVLAAAGRLLFWVPVVDVVAGIFYFVNLVVGFFIAFLLLALGFSFILLVPAVAVENCSSADALQRSVAYLLSRPLHLLGYVIVGLVGLVIGYIVVALVGAATLNITGATTGWFTDHAALVVTGGFWIDDLSQPARGIHDTGTEAWSTGAVAFWQGVVILLVASYIVSYLFSSTTMIYLLMRKLVDDQDTTEIWRPGLVPGTLAPMPAAITRPVHEPGGTATFPDEEKDDVEGEADDFDDEESNDDDNEESTIKKKKKSKKKKKK